MSKIAILALLTVSILVSCNKASYQARNERPQLTLELARDVESYLDTAEGDTPKAYVSPRYAATLVRCQPGLRLEVFVEDPFESLVDSLCPSSGELQKDLLLDAPADGEYPVVARVSDQEGASAQKSIILVRDTEAPALKPLESKASASRGAKIQCEPGALIEEGSKKSTCPNGGVYELRLENDGEGSVIVRVESRDAAGNKSVAQKEFFYDNSAEDVFSGFEFLATRIANVRTNQASVEISTAGFSLQQGARIEIYSGKIQAGLINRQSMEAGSFTLSAPELNAQSPLYARAFDDMGNQAELEAAAGSYTHDDTPPALSAVFSPSALEKNSLSRVLVEGSCESGASKVSLSFLEETHSVDCQQGSWQKDLDISSLEPGQYHASASQSDLLGNTSGAQAQLEITPDVTAPLVSLSAINPFVEGELDKVAVSGSCQEAGSFLELSLDGAPFFTGLCPQGGLFSFDLEEAAVLNKKGEYQLSAAHRDGAGNQSSASAVLRILADETAPSLTLAASGQDSRLAGESFSVNVSGQCESGASNVEIHLASGEYSEPAGEGIASGACSEQSFSFSVSVENIAAGAHHLVASQSDGYGNRGFSDPVTFEAKEPQSLDLAVYQSANPVSETVYDESLPGVSVESPCEPGLGVVFSAYVEKGGERVLVAQEPGQTCQGLFVKELEVVEYYDQAAKYVFELVQENPSGAVSSEATLLVRPVASWQSADNQVVYAPSINLFLNLPPYLEEGNSLIHLTSDSGFSRTFQLSEALAGMEVFPQEGVNVFSAVVEHNEARSLPIDISVEKRSAQDLTLELVGEQVRNHSNDNTVSVQGQCEPRLSLDLKMSSYLGEILSSSVACSDTGDYSHQFPLDELEIDEQMGAFEITAAYTQLENTEVGANLTIKPVIAFDQETLALNGSATVAEEVLVKIANANHIGGETIMSTGVSFPPAFALFDPGRNMALAPGSNRITLVASHRGVDSEPISIEVTRILPLTLSLRPGFDVDVDAGEISASAVCQPGLAVDFVLNQNEDFLFHSEICPESGEVSKTALASDLGVGEHALSARYRGYPEVGHARVDAVVRPAVYWSQQTMDLESQILGQDNNPVSLSAHLSAGSQDSQVYVQRNSDEFYPVADISAISVALANGENTVRIKAVKGEVESTAKSVTFAADLEGPYLTIGSENTVVNFTEGEQSVNWDVPGACESTPGSSAVKLYLTKPFAYDSSIHDDAPVASYVCQGEPGAYSGNIGYIQLRHLEAGNWELVATQSDDAGNVSLASVSFVVAANTEPHPTVEEIADFTQGSLESVVFKGDCSPDEGALYFFVSGSVSETYSPACQESLGRWEYEVSSVSGVQVKDLEPGSYGFKIMQLDRHTGTQHDSDILEFTVTEDNESPVVTINNSPHWWPAGSALSDLEDSASGQCETGLEVEVGITIGSEIVVIGKSPCINGSYLANLDIGHAPTEPGEHYQMRAYQTDAAGNPGKSGIATVEVYNPEPQVVGISLDRGIFIKGESFPVTAEGVCEESRGSVSVYLLTEQEHPSEGDSPYSEVTCWNDYSVEMENSHLDGLDPGVYHVVAVQSNKYGVKGYSGWVQLEIAENQYPMVTFDQPHYNHPFGSGETLILSGVCSQGEEDELRLELLDASGEIQGSVMTPICVDGHWNTESSSHAGLAMGDYTVKIEQFDYPDTSYSAVATATLSVVDSNPPSVEIASLSKTSFIKGEQKYLEISGTCSEEDSYVRIFIEDSDSIVPEFSNGFGGACSGGEFTVNLGIANFSNYNDPGLYYVIAVAENEHGTDGNSEWKTFTLLENTPPSVGINSIENRPRGDEDPLLLSGSCSLNEGELRVIVKKESGGYSKVKYPVCHEDAQNPGSGTWSVQMEDPTGMTEGEYTAEITQYDYPSLTQYKKSAAFAVFVGTVFIGNGTLAEVGLAAHQDTVMITKNSGERGEVIVANLNQDGTLKDVDVVMESNGSFFGNMYTPRMNRSGQVLVAGVNRVYIFNNTNLSWTLNKTRLNFGASAPEDFELSPATDGFAAISLNSVYNREACVSSVSYSGVNCASFVGEGFLTYLHGGSNILVSLGANLYLLDQSMTTSFTNIMRSNGDVTGLSGHGSLFAVAQNTGRISVFDSLQELDNPIWTLEESVVFDDLDFSPDGTKLLARDSDSGGIFLYHLDPYKGYLMSKLHYTGDKPLPKFGITSSHISNNFIALISEGSLWVYPLSDFE